MTGFATGSNFFHTIHMLLPIYWNQNIVLLSLEKVTIS
jgi:hypothetical protein